MSDSPQPKSLFGSAESPPNSPPSPPPRPKSIFDQNPKEREIKVLLNGVVPKGEKPTGPKTLLTDAKIRKRIEVSIEDLRKYGESDPVLKKSQQQIRETNVDELCLKYVLNWGSELQETHSRHLQEMMSLSTVPILNQTKTTIGNIIQKMNGVDIVGAMKDSWYKSKDKKITELQDELKYLQSEASTLRPDYLLDVHERGEIMKDELKQLKSELDPYIITCSFFASYKREDFPSELYISRLSSLLSTKASIGNDLITIDSIIGTYLMLIETINSIIRNELPMWMSNLSSVLSGNAADITLIQTTKTNIINKLTKTL